MDIPRTKQINSIRELKKYIGKPLVFYRTPNANKVEEPNCMWIKTLTKINDMQFTNGININDYIINVRKKAPMFGIEIYGTNTVILKGENYHEQLPLFREEKEAMSNAQHFVRTLTAQEALLYRMMIKQHELKNKKELYTVEF